MRARTLLVLALTMVGWTALVDDAPTQTEPASFVSITPRDATSEAEAKEVEWVTVDIAKAAGIHEIGQSWTSSIVDLQGDGFEDLLLVLHAERPARLFQNSGGSFSEIASGTFTQKDRHYCDWSDVNQDGLIDAYCSVGADFGRAIKANELYLQTRQGSFTEVAKEYGVDDVFGRGRGVAFVDVNRDIYPDLFLGNQQPRADGLPTSNRLFMNVGGTHFVDAPSFGLNEEIGGHCAENGDYDGDGWEDLLVCTNGGLRLYKNLSGVTFADVTKATGIVGKAGTSKARFADLDTDRQLDVVSVSRGNLQVQLQAGSHFAAPSSSRSLQRGLDVAVGDVNGDDAPDVYVTQGAGFGTNAPDLMLVNDGTGRSFEQVSIPQTIEGRGQSVTAIDHDADGSTDFVVTNGWNVFQGPVQLISFKKCSMTGTMNDDVLMGTDGNDIICGLGGDDRIEGGGGDDVVVGAAGIDTMTGGPGDDTIKAGDGDDQLAGNNGDDSLSGGEGDDLLINGAAISSDVFDGGPGVDRVTYPVLEPPLVVTRDGWPNDAGQGDHVVADVETITGATELRATSLGIRLATKRIEDDSIEQRVIATVSDQFGDPLDDAFVWVHVLGANAQPIWTGRTIQGVVEFPYRFAIRGIDRVRVHADADADGLVDDSEAERFVVKDWTATCPGFEADPRNQIVGTPDVDSLRGTDDKDIICGLGADDGLSSLSGDDLLLGGKGDDALDGGLDDDVLRGGDGTDQLHGEEGADRLHGDGDDDRLDGGPGNDYLDGGAGIDLCLPGTGSEITAACEG